MSDPPVTSSWRAAAAGTALCGLLAYPAWALGHLGLTGAIGVQEAAGAAPVEAGITALAALLGAATLTWLLSILALGTLAVLPPVRPGATSRPRSWAVRQAPRWAPRASAALLMLSLVSPSPAVGAAAEGTQLTASASPAPAIFDLGQPPLYGEHGPAGDGTDNGTRDGADAGHGTRAADDSGDDAGSGDQTLPVPGWAPTSRTPPSTADVHLLARGEVEDHTVTVHRGDTLWSIAAAHLGTTATLEQIAESWPRWHAANRAVIGGNPHLILPGQQLRPPSRYDAGARP